MIGPSLDAVARVLLAPVGERTAPPGVVVAIAEGDDVRTGAAGVADVESDEPATTAHAQDLASVGKVLTTLATLALVGRGLLTLDTTVGAVLGERAGHASAATVEDLLRHRAGFRPWWPLYLEPGAAEDPVGVTLALPPLHEAGTTRIYSDLGMQVLGAVVARATGATFSDAVRALVLDPIGADTVTPGAPRVDLPALSGPEGDEIEREMVRSGTPYPVDRNDAAFAWRSGTIVREIADGNAFHVFRGAAGHAGWFADVAGLLRIASALADPSILAPDDGAIGTAALLASAVDDGQGLGVRRFDVTWRGRDRTLVGHPGFTGAFVAAAPEEGGHPPLRVALLANRLHGRPAPRRERLADIDDLWRRVLTVADPHLTTPTSGERP